MRTRVGFAAFPKGQTHLNLIPSAFQDTSFLLCTYILFQMAANKLFFCLHVNYPSLPHFHFKILLCFIHVGVGNGPSKTLSLAKF